MRLAAHHAFHSRSATLSAKGSLKMTRIKHSLQLQLSLIITILLFIIALISGSLSFTLIHSDCAARLFAVHHAVNISSAMGLQ